MNGKSGHDKQHTKGGLEKRTRREKKIEKKEGFEWLVDEPQRSSGSREMGRGVGKK
jgi:hypothetical protein